jgi:tRNA(Leu) C34 or U34 (ribose-2'-O)-methylase TrmL
MRPPSMPAPPVVATARVDDTNEIAERQRADEARRAERAARLVDAATWRAYALELEAARGPRPTAAIERLYVERYVPLLGAIARGECDAGVRQLVEQWRRDFREGYESAFASLRVTAKRPTMVMDAPDVAHRVARLASARSVKLVLVDAMSFDLGDRVAKRLASQLDKRAVLVEKNVLWSALPSTTPTQLHLLARGPEGLKDSLAPATESDVARGRNVVVFRRERLGAREVLKLDVVEARLRAQGDGYDARLDALADELAAALAKLFDTLPPRTLAYVFGDHGFVLGPGANGWATGAGSQGGSSPEEVLVGGQAWLLDAMH